MDTDMDTNNNWARDVTVSDRRTIVGHYESVPLMTFNDFHRLYTLAESLVRNNKKL